MNRRKSIFPTGPEPQVNTQQQQNLSNEIDENLRTLALFHPFSDIAKPLFVKDAFLKANKPAFHHIVQYLLVIISSVEFRKRFRWPVVSASDEKDFRMSALTYFNDCHEKHKWDFGPFKMQIVLFPGGIEFMKIIIEMSKMAMFAVLKESGSSLQMNEKCMTLREAKAKLQAAEETFEQLEQFRSKIRVLSNPLKESTKRLNELLQRILCRTAIPQHLIGSKFLSTWESTQQNLIDNKIPQSLDELDRIVSKCTSLQQLMNNTKPQNIEFDREKMSKLGLLNMSQHLNPQINYDKLFEWIKNAMPDLITAIYCKPPWSITKLERESYILHQLLIRTDEQLNRLEMLNEQCLNSNCLPTKTQEHDDCKMVSTDYLNEALILTPTINVDKKKNHRIAIWEAIPSICSPATVKSSFNYAVDENTDGDDIMGLSNFTKLRSLSSKLDPMSMLNSAMQRSGYTKPKASPRRNGLPISPARFNNNNLPGFNSTMLPKNDQITASSRPFPLSPLRKSLF